MKFIARMTTLIAAFLSLVATAQTVENGTNDFSPSQDNTEPITEEMVPGGGRRKAWSADIHKPVYACQHRSFRAPCTGWDVDPVKKERYYSKTDLKRQGFDDNLSSIDILDGYKVKLCTKGSEKGFCNIYYGPTAIRTLPLDMEDEVSSIKIWKVSP